MTLAPTILTYMADASSASSVMHAYITPVMRTLCVLASLVCVFFLINGGIHYMASAGKPDNLEQAKRVIRNALIGLVIVLAAGGLTAILSHAYASSSSAMPTKLPTMTQVKPDKVSNGLVDVLIKAITGLLNNIIQAVAQPFLKALSTFTTSTQLMASNSSVFNLWLVIVAIADALFVLVVALLGFHVMGAPTFGFDELEFKHLLPRFGLIFLAINTSIFVIDGVIELSNVMIHAVNAAGGAGSVWDTLTKVVKQSGGESVAALLVMLAFLIFSVILLVYYVGRLVTLYVGAVLSPLLLLLWLLPGFRDFSETAAKTYLTTIFVLFVHVVILQLAASLFAGMSVGSANQLPDTLMSMVVGLATLIAILKTQGVMMQFSYVSMGSRNARKLGGQFATGVSYVTGKGRAVATNIANRNQPVPATAAAGGRNGSKSYTTTQSYRQPQSTAGAASSKRRAKTGTTSSAPQLGMPKAKSSVKDHLKEKP